MAESKGIKETLELLGALKEIGLVARKALKDGKVNLADLALLGELLKKQEEILAAFKDLGELPKEMKDISTDEAALIIATVMSAVKEIKEA